MLWYYECCVDMVVCCVMQCVCSAIEKSFAVLEPIVRVVIVLCATNGSDNRIQICRLGEAIFVPLLRVWKNKPADRLKVMDSLSCLSFLLELQLILVTIHRVFKKCGVKLFAITSSTVNQF